MKTAKMLTILVLRSELLRRVALVLAMGLMVCLTGVSKAEEPMGTAWTYQGRLMDKNRPADGLYDFQFKLYDSNDPCTGTQLASPIDINDLDVIDGHFIVELDFGSGIFDGNAVWLETRIVRSPMGSDPAALSPLLELTPTPYALYAQTTGAGHSLDAADGSPTNAVYVDDEGHVGIGTNSPAARLTVNGAILRDGSTMYGTNADTHINLGTNCITGTDGENTLYATISGGLNNDANDSYATVGGGVSNIASHYGATVGGGTANIASGSNASVGGGSHNEASGDVATVGGGGGNNASGWYATVPGGGDNAAGGYYSFAAGRRAKVRDAAASGDYTGDEGTFVWADSTNADFQSTGPDQFLIRASGGVGIGTNNPAANAQLTVNGAILRHGSTMYGPNAATHINLGTSSTTGMNGQDYSYATVGGGSNNKASYDYATVGGGQENTASKSRDTVAGGAYNTASGNFATVGGGLLNTASDAGATVGGGEYNTASGYIATVGGGVGNTVSGYEATVGGGYYNRASGMYSTVPGGYLNVVDGDYSFAAGLRAKANHDGAFVWADSTAADFASTANDQFIIRASGGVGIGTSSPDRTLEISGILRVAQEENNANGADFSYVVDEPVTGHDGLIIDSDTGGGWSDIHLRTKGTTKLFVESNGNVGIGTTKPTQKLEVNGNVVVQSSIDVGGSVYVGSAVNAGFTVKAGSNVEAGGDVIANNDVYVKNMKVLNTGYNVTINPSTGKLSNAGSSRRHKNDIKPFITDFSKILRAEPKSFVYKANPDKADIGFIAEDFDELGLKELVVYNKNGEPDNIKYDKISIYLLEAIKELKAENDELQEQNNRLESRLSALENVMRSGSLIGKEL